MNRLKRFLCDWFGHRYHLTKMHDNSIAHWEEFTCERCGNQYHTQTETWIAQEPLYRPGTTFVAEISPHAYLVDQSRRLH